MDYTNAQTTIAHYLKLRNQKKDHWQYFKQINPGQLWNLGLKIR